MGVATTRKKSTDYRSYVLTKGDIKCVKIHDSTSGN